MQKHRVLIVEDEQDIAGLIKHTLERSGSAEAEIVGSGDAALKAVTARPPDLIILDRDLLELVKQDSTLDEIANTTVMSTASQPCGGSRGTALP